MAPLVANTEDLISILDRVLDMGILVEPWVRVSLDGIHLVSIDATVDRANFVLEDAAIYVGYAEKGTWMEISQLERVFPYWRKDLWTK